MNQREGVFKAVVAVVGEVNGKVELTDTQKKTVYAMLETGFLQGEIEYKGERTPERIKKYVPGLVNNWLRKDTRLNGGEKYTTKNPGSRAGSGDESIKAMRTLLQITTDAQARAEIEAAIAARQAELKPKVTVDLSALPEHLRHLVKVA